MRGGSYRRVGDQLERLDRETNEWHPCDEQGVVAEPGEGGDLATEGEFETVDTGE